VWVLAVAAGITLGRPAPTPGRAFLHGAVVAFLTANGAGAALACVLGLAAVNQWPSAPLAFGLAVSAMPPALMGGMLAAVSRSRLARRQHLQEGKGLLCLSPDIEQAARARFNPSGKSGDEGAVWPADEGVREEGGG